MRLTTPATAISIMVPHRRFEDPELSTDHAMSLTIEGSTEELIGIRNAIDEAISKGEGFHVYRTGKLQTVGCGHHLISCVHTFYEFRLDDV